MATYKNMSSFYSNHVQFYRKEIIKANEETILHSTDSNVVKTLHLWIYQLQIPEITELST